MLCFTSMELWYMMDSKSPTSLICNDKGPTYIFLLYRHTLLSILLLRIWIQELFMPWSSTSIVAFAHISIRFGKMAYLHDLLDCAGNFPPHPPCQYALTKKKHHLLLVFKLFNSKQSWFVYCLFFFILHCNLKIFSSYFEKNQPQKVNYNIN